MPVHERKGGVDLAALQEHLSEALDNAESDHTKYHLREASQKVVILEEEG